MNRLSLVLLSSLRSIVRGVAISALTRADTLKDFNITNDSFVLTFDYCEDYRAIESKLQDAGYLEQSTLINIFDYFSTFIYSKNKISGGEILKLLKKVNFITKEKQNNKCIKYILSDGRVIFEYFNENNDVYLRAITLGGAFLWDYTPIIELYNNDKLIKRFYSNRDFWAYFIECVSNSYNKVHIFQDASYNNKVDTRDVFCAIKRGRGYFNYRIAHGSTMIDIYNDNALPIHSWRDDEYWNDYDAVVFLTNTQRKQWISSQGNEGNLVVVPHESGRQNLGFTSRRGNRCVYITSLTKPKRVDMAIKAFTKVISEVPSAFLEVYGQGPEYSNLIKLINDLKVEKHVSLLGYKIDAQQYLKGAACSLFTSERESFGMPIIESYAYSCPVVAFNVNYGPSELVIDGKTGFKNDFGDVEGVAHSIIKVLKNESTVFRENAYYESKQYEKKKIADLWKNLLDKAEMRCSY